MELCHQVLTRPSLRVDRRRHSSKVSCIKQADPPWRQVADRFALSLKMAKQSWSFLCCKRMTKPCPVVSVLHYVGPPHKPQHKRAVKV